jgi:hypothetical protein
MVRISSAVYFRVRVAGAACRKFVDLAAVAKRGLVLSAG